MDDLFASQTLQIRQPGRLLPNRARYEIFDGERQLLAIAAETHARARLELFAGPEPDARVLAITTAAGTPLLTLIKYATERVTELRSPDGEPAGCIRATHLNRHYTLVDDQEQTVGKVVGDLALKHFGVSAAGGGEFARIRKTWAGPKEMVTPADHYRVEFTAPVSAPARVLTVMMAIVLDLTLFGPF